MLEDRKIFALDIGTRSVIGIILEKNNGNYHVADMVLQEHSERAMLDGQIHDVLAVSKVIEEVKEKLEKTHGPLKKVCVAAAGRSLVTECASETLEIQGKPLMQKQDILHLELSAVQQAQAIVAEKYEKDKKQNYYCVGYSVLGYKLDGEEIGNLIDQQGEAASVDIIATFLPKVVVESLLSALQRADLEMEALTLEPIAAINVLIPPSMRRLNVALVDVGAGTSDIAITDMGTVIAYGMVPVAGDEITEEISDQLLLDFPLAEKAKRELYSQETITITDILGFESEVRRDEIIEKISSALDRLASAICQEILHMNNKPPKAVMLVGGGSLTPELPKRISEKLGLPENRVAIRGIDAIASLSAADQISKGPDLVTPIGIAIAAHQSPVQYHTVEVNGRPVRLFEVKKMTVGDCLLAAGIKINKLYGKPGLAMIVSVNGQRITIPGGYGEPPLIMQNGQPSTFDSEIKNGDKLIVEKGKDGEKAALYMKDLIDEIPSKEIMINGKNYRITAKITCNGQEASPDSLVVDRDSIECRMPETIEELLAALELYELAAQIKPFKITINGKETFIPPLSGKIIKNGREMKPYHSFENHDDIRIEKKGTITLLKLAELKQLILSQSLPITFNGNPVTIAKPVVIIKRNGNVLTEQEIITDGDQLTFEEGKLDPFIFQDIFGHVDIEIPKKSGGAFELLQNGEKATFYSKLEPGDQLQIVWPENTDAETVHTKGAVQRVSFD